MYPIPIDWGDLERSQRLPDTCDVVALTVADLGDPTAIEFFITLEAGLDWWKALKVVVSGNTKGLLEVYGNSVRSAGPLRLADHDVRTGGVLYLGKAKSFGVPTFVYSLSGLEERLGKSITFRWVADSCPK